MLRPTLILLSCTFAIIAFFAVIGYMSCNSPPIPNSEAAKTEQSYKENGAPLYAAFKCEFFSIGGFIHDYREEIVAVGTVFIAAFTIILGIATAALYAATRDLVKGAEETARRQLRAYISAPIEAKIRGFMEERPLVEFSFKNSGQTPAYDLTLWGTFYVMPFPLDTKPVAPEDKRARPLGVRGPGEVFNMQLRSTQPITEAQRAQVRSGEAAIFVYVEIGYIDAFAGQRVATVCLYYGGDAGCHPEGLLATYHKWNEAN